MIVPRRQDIKHKIQLFRLLRAILSNDFLANALVFKGGTYASLLNVLDRFSVDLDFDLPDKTATAKVRNELYKVFNDLGLAVKDESKKYLQFFLKYSAPDNERNTLELDINDQPSKFNTYQRVRLSEIRMFCRGHAPETMFANKLIVAKARFDKAGKIAGRDFYDIRRFFEQGIGVNVKVVEDLSGLSYKEYLKELLDLIEREVSDKTLREDLAPLMKIDFLNKELPHLKPELIMFLEGEIGL